ncbi:MAG: ligase-associated DNA damage response DEXH box helicase [Lewinella sp.]|nr:ligase-associated DNA damage response DEXH box helicase [Lewinella sp.]
MSKKNTEALLETAEAWFASRGWQPFTFQRAAWRAYLAGEDGLVNAPTGSGKTYSLILPILLEFIHDHPEDYDRTDNGLRAIWITPIRALTREIQQAAQQAADELGLHWRVGIRSGDTSTSERQKQKSNPPEILITTPESLHLLLATKGYGKLFRQLRAVIVDEWHELVGSKRGVQMELALSRLRGFLPDLKIWGISATIGNLDEALDVLLGPQRQDRPHQVIRSGIHKQVDIQTVLPDTIETFPWAGHLGIRLLEKVIPIIQSSGSTLIFTNTRAQCEIWYQRLLEVVPDLAGVLAMHHGSISRELRDWVENALHEGTLKAVVCTSSLDLGVDFRPVETIIQIGSPKGVARFLQRAGRSGHQPGATSRIYFVPTHSLEILEGAALRQAGREQQLESRLPYIRSFDVLMQYLVTLAVSDGFRPADIYEEVRGTYSFQSVSPDEWAWLLDFITTGGASLGAYDEFHKVVVESGIYQVTSRRVALRHRLNIGAIVSDSNLRVKYVSGGYLGSVEEWFVAQLKPGDVFWFAGRSLELVRIKEMMVQVRRSRQTKGKVPAWMGGRMPLSSQLTRYLRLKLTEVQAGDSTEPELQILRPLIEKQQERSAVPRADQLLIEYFQDREGYHLLVYPFEGRLVHEGMGSLLAYRISQLQPISFSIAMNDYGFELLSDQEIPIQQALAQGLFSQEGLSQDIQASINAAELAKRKFRDIASISGLIFKGYPGKQKKDKHLQSSAQLFFEVFSDYEPDNLLLQQAYEEGMTFQLEAARLREALQRINEQEICLEFPHKATPFSFPIIVDRLRERLSSERLEDRIAKMKLRLEA